MRVTDAEFLHTLACLVQGRYAVKDPERKIYRPGVDAMQLGMAPMKKVPLVGECQGFMKKLARATGEPYAVLRP